MKTLYLRVPDELHAAIAKQADRERRSITKQATILLLIALNVTKPSRLDRM